MVWGGRVGTSPKADFSSLDNEWTRTFIDRGERVMCRKSRISADTHLEIGHRWSDQCHPDCLKYSYSSVPGLVCSHFLKSFLRTVAAYVMATVRSSYSSLPGGGFSTYKTAHRIWLRIFSIALEKELRGPWKD